MIIYRLVNSKYKDDLSGYGAFLFGGRWNSKGAYALYAAEHISLAALEIVVNYDRMHAPLLPEYALMEIWIPDIPAIQINRRILKPHWQGDFSYSQYMGDQFLQEKQHLVLKMPSAVIPEECNYMLNPLHPDFKKVKIKSSLVYGLDSRLFS